VRHLAPQCFGHKSSGLR